MADCIVIRMKMMVEVSGQSLESVTSSRYSVTSKGKIVL